MNWELLWLPVFGIGLFSVGKLLIRSRRKRLDLLL